MSNRVIAKLKGRGLAFRQIFGDMVIYDVPTFADVLEYDDEWKLEDGQWFKVEEFTAKEYCPNYLIEGLQTTYTNIDGEYYDKIDYLFGTMNDENVIWFLNVTPSRYIKRPLLQYFNNEPNLINDSRKILELSNEPNAFLDVPSNTLYFKNLSTLTSIFKGIEVLFREATDEEVQEFIDTPVISMGDGYLREMIKTPNRKRLKAAKERYDSFTNEQKNLLNEYLHNYCPELARAEDGSYIVSNEAELTKLLNGINQRYYTTPIDNERRLANSVSVLI